MRYWGLVSETGLEIGTRSGGGGWKDCECEVNTGSSISEDVVGDFEINMAYPDLGKFRSVLCIVISERNRLQVLALKR